MFPLVASDKLIRVQHHAEEQVKSDKPQSNGTSRLAPPNLVATSQHTLEYTATYQHTYYIFINLDEKPVGTM